MIPGCDILFNIVEFQNMKKKVLLSKGIDQFEIHLQNDKQHENANHDDESSTKI